MDFRKKLEEKGYKVIDIKLGKKKEVTFTTGNKITYYEDNGLQLASFGYGVEKKSTQKLFEQMLKLFDKYKVKKIYNLEVEEFDNNIVIVKFLCKELIEMLKNSK